MADQVDTMSDAELRTKLAEHGFPIMPITASTRKLLVKKLKLVLDNKTKSRLSVDSKAESRRSLAKYSSGEDSDLETSNVREKRSRRATTGGAMLPPVSSRTRRGTPKHESPVKIDNDKGSESEDEKSPVRTEVLETVTTRRLTRTVKDRDDYETGSDSDIDVDKKGSKPFRSSSSSSNYISSTLPTNDTNTSPPKSSFLSRPTLSTDYGLHSTSDHLNAMRSRLGLTTSLDRPSSSTYSSTYRNSYQPTTTTDEVESPFLSNFTRRYTSVNSDAPRSTFIDREISTPNNGATVFPRRSYISTISRSDADYKSHDKKFLRTNVVSLALVGIVALFFFCLFFMYIVKKNDIASIVDEQNSVIPICQLNIPGNRQGINCVPKDQISYAKDLLKVIHPELTSRTAAFKCGKPGVMPYMTIREIMDIANARADTENPNRIRDDINNLQVLIVSNPNWGLNLVQLKSLYSKEADFTPLTTFEQVLEQRSKGTIAVSLIDPSTPLSCLAMSTLYSAGSTVVIVALLTVLGFSLHRFYKFYLNYRKRKNDEVYSLVTQIIDTISQETEDTGEPFISVDHIRDTLISPQNREKMSPIWDAAVKFIQKNESRVRMEIQSVNGEDCRVWRWVSSQSSPRRSAAWQGQAFETQEGSVNNLTVSPTPCLKIRHMFEKNDNNPNLKTVIQDAILDKCGDRCRILHIDMDRAACCVYVKCASEADAGVVYRSLHGWWFRGNLITVKYLRLERYMQRFPNSPSSGPYLVPSSQKHSWDG